MIARPGVPDPNNIAKDVKLMKNTILALVTATHCALPIVLAQGSHLADPDDPNNHALVVAPGGNVGVKTAVPRDSLHVAGNARVGGSATDGGIAGSRRYLALENDVADPNSHAMLAISTTWSGGDPYINFGVTGPVQAWAMGVDNSDGQKFKLTARAGTSGLADVADGSTVLAVDPSGNLGIGTNSPGSTLHVHGNGIRATGVNPYMLLQPDDTDQYAMLTAATANGAGVSAARQYDTVLTACSNGNLLFGIGYAERMRISNEGNVGIGTDPRSKLDVAGKVICTVLELTSDRAQKTGFAVVDNIKILNRVATLPLTTWHYTNELGVTHIGPMAQDFRTAFNVGSDAKHIATVDADGVLFAAVQGLNQKLETALREKDARIAALEKEVGTLRQDLLARVAALEKRAGEPDLQRVDASVVPPATLAAVGQPR